MNRRHLCRMMVGMLLLWPLVAAGQPSAPAAPVVLERSQKICQVLGECDRQLGGAGECTGGLLGKPTLNLTESRVGLFGTDLGASFEHNGRVYFLFGDTIASGLNPPPSARPHDSDSVAYSVDTNPDDCLALQFATSADGFYRPLTVPGVSLATFETPVGGFSVGEKMYVFATTDAKVVSVQPTAVTLGRSVLARSTDEAQSFTRVYDASTAKFINIAPAVVNNADVPGLPSATGQGVLLWGSGTAFRQSDPYLAYIPLDSVEDHTAWRYFAGIQNGLPSWSTQESSSVALFSDTPCLGELSVSWNPFLHEWVMLYNCLNPFGIVLRVAKQPWGPWSSAEVIFDPTADNGWCHFIHWPDNISPTPFGPAPCDALSDAGANNVFGGPYGPYIISRHTRADAASTTMYYLMSTFNPYTVVLMKVTLERTLPSCNPVPLGSCRKPIAKAASTLQLKENADGSKNALTWQWRKGEATAAADLGDPVSGATDYVLCTYDSAPNLIASASAPGGGVCGKKPCWKTTKAGFSYMNKSLTPDGLLRLQLTSGPGGKAKIVAKGKGSNLVLPALPLTQSPTVAVQLQNSGGVCWEAGYSAPANKNDTATFKDKSD